MKSFLDLYKMSTDTLLTVMNDLNFFFALASHLDASLLDDLREKLSSLLEPAVQPELNTKHMKHTEKERFYSTASGVYGGRENVLERVKMAKANKTLLHGALKTPAKRSA